MEDKFEKFISENRDQFDFREPYPGIWKKIEANIRPKKHLNLRIIISRAAAVLLIFAASYAVNEFVHRHRHNRMETEKKRPSQKEIAIPELQEAEAYYSGLIDKKLEEVKPILANCPSLEKELQIDMTELDSVCLDLKKDLKDNIANQEVIDAIIENYRMKIAILEDLRKEIKPGKNECNSNKGKYAI